MTSELPPGWALTDLGTLGRYINGRGFGKAEWRKSGLPIIRIQNLNDEAATFNYSDKEHEEKYRVEDGDLLVSWAASLGVYVWNRGPAWLNQHIFRVEPEVRLVTQPFLYYSLKHAIEALYKKSHGSGMVHVTKGKFDSHPIKLPPIAEQKRIVSKIDELFSRIDEGERALDRVQKLVERYRQSVLKAAVTGELTREWREKNKDKLESGEALLARILKARREAWEKGELAGMKAKGIKPVNELWKLRYEEPVRPDTTELPELPSGWLWVSMDMLTRDFITGPFGSALHKSDYIVDGIPLINPTNLRGGTITPDNAVTVSPETLERLARYKLQLGDIVLARRGEMGRCAAVTSEEIGWMCGTGSAILRCTSEVLPEFAALALSSLHSRKFLEDNCAGTTMHNLNQDAMARVPVPVAGIGEQNAALDLLRKQITSASVLDKQCLGEERRSSALRHSVLKSAFNGELVVQDLADEPASDLLTRIAEVRRAHDAALERLRTKKTSA
jgi:type I restriction enzyme S subunit